MVITREGGVAARAQVKGEWQWVGRGKKYNMSHVKLSFREINVYSSIIISSSQCFGSPLFGHLTKLNSVVFSCHRD